MIIESLASSIVVGKLRKGKITNIEETELKGWYFFLIALGLEVLPNLFRNTEWGTFNVFLNNNFIYIHLLSYVLLFTAIVMNFKKKSMWFILAGTLLNFIVIMANGGQMPVWFEGINAAGIIEPDAVHVSMDFSHKLINDTTRLSFLSDIIPLPKPYPLPKILSIGDILLAAGVFVFIQEAMVKKQIKADNTL